MNQRERMLSGLPYKAWLDGLEEDRQACKQKIYDFNQLPPSRQSKEAPQMIKNIFGKTGENVWVEAPFHCDYGWNIEVGENFYSNYNLTILDVGKVTCGKNVQIAPNVSIYTAGHPVHPDSRNSGYEYGYNLSVMIAWLHTITANIYPELGTSRNATGRHLYLLEHFTLKKSS